MNPATGVWNRVAVVCAGTNRELFIDGTSRATQSGITARDADFDALSVGIDDTSLNESLMVIWPLSTSALRLCPPLIGSGAFHARTLRVLHHHPDRRPRPGGNLRQRGRND